MQACMSSQLVASAYISWTGYIRNAPKCTETILGKGKARFKMPRNASKAFWGGVELRRNAPKCSKSMSWSTHKLSLHTCLPQHMCLPKNMQKTLENYHSSLLLVWGVSKRACVTHMCLPAQKCLQYLSKRSISLKRAACEHV